MHNNSNNKMENKSSISNKNAAYSPSRSLRGRSVSQDKVQEKPIKLNQFLDFVTASCHLNDMINSSVDKTSHKTALRTKSEIDFNKLADNVLVNDLYGLKRHKQATSIEEQLAADKANGARAPHSTSIASTFTGYTTAAVRKPSAAQLGLHTKLREKLDFVINEGVMDSVLPFICPIPVVSNNTRAAAAAKVKVMPQPKLALVADPTIAAQASNALLEKEKQASAAAAAHAMENGNLAVHHASVSRISEQDKANMKNSSNNQRRKPILFQFAREIKPPEVIIHVCDEQKNTSHDFSCPQSLLVSKMGYFADVTAGQKLEDMDISVHCDVQIFDWLMKWMRHSESIEHGTLAAFEQGPQLDAANVVPILVSASFLQMEPLLLECLSFCHARLSDVVRSSANLACMNDSIVTRLAAMFTNLEMESVRDKKERLTPRLWTKLLQSLCEPEPEALRGHYYSMAGLFRCAKCGKLITNTMKSYVPCVASHVRLNRWGQLISRHVRDTNWDINSYIAQLFKELKSWRLVYWKMWGHCHFLYCGICETYFPAYQLTWCRYHPEGAHFLGPATEGCMAGPTGRYPCCGQQAFRFETLPGANGCQFREHSVLVENDRERAIHAIAQLIADNYALTEDPPQRLQEAVCREEIEPRWLGMPLVPTRGRQGLLPQLNPEESTSRVLRRVRHSMRRFDDSGSASSSSDSESSPQAMRKQVGGFYKRHDYYSSSDGCESEQELVVVPRANRNKRKTRKRFTYVPGRLWSGDVSARSNQDNQRDFEEKVMKQIQAIVNKRCGFDSQHMQQQTPAGGVYVRLEAEWREQLRQRNNNSNTVINANSGANGSSSSAQLLAKHKNNNK